MRHSVILGIITSAGLFFGTATAPAAVYNYSGGTANLPLNNGDWTTETVGPNFSSNWNFFFAKSGDGSSTNYDQLQVIKTGDVAQGSPGDVWQGAIFWEAPANEVITSVSLDYWVQGSNTRTYGIFYTGDSLGTANSYKTYGGLTSTVYSGSDTVNFTVAQHITSIGLAVYGTNANAKMFNSWGGKFTNPVITTAVPEPAVIATLGLAIGMMGLSRRRRRA